MLIKIIYILTTLTVTNPQTPNVYKITSDTITSTVPAAYYEANAELYRLPEVEVIRIDTIR